MFLPRVAFPKGQAFPQFIPSTRHCHRTISTPVHGVFSLEKPMRNVKRAGIIPFMPNIVVCIMYT